MLLQYWRHLLCILIWTFGSAGAAIAEVRLPALISDNMVLQQHTQAHLWGQAAPGEEVRATLGRYQAVTQADAQGYWSLYLPRIPAGIYELHIRGQAPDGQVSNHKIRNVAVGEVWVAAGQSNMEWPLSRTADAASALAKAQHPEIRFFKVHKQTALSPRDEVSGYWDVLTPETAADISGVAYYFAQYVQDRLAVPVGVIQSSWGSTQVAAWTGLEAMQTEPVLKPLLAAMQQQLSLSAAEKQRQNAPLRDWEAANFLQDPGNQGEKQGLAAVDYDDSGWQAVSLPQKFSQIAFDGDGAVWFRRTLTLNENWQGQDEDALLLLGTIDDFDTAYVNGVQVGATDASQPHHWLYERRYRVPGRLLTAGKNVIAVRVFDQYGDGGFTGRAQGMNLVQGQRRLSLAGTWKYKSTYQAEAMQADFATIPPPLYGLGNRNTPAALFNAMIAPLTAYPVQGVIWYQGESDADDAQQYKAAFPLMIRQWRQSWQQNFPFLFVQLANFEFDSPDAPRQKWAEIRAVQSWVNDTVSNTGMVSAIDVGEADDVHPEDKLTVGKRLARLALNRVYGEAVPYRGPVYHSFSVEATDSGEQQVRLQFDNAAGLHAEGEVVAFELAAEDGRFYPAQAKLEGDSIVLSAKAVQQPVRVRYAWRDNPQANVYNGDDLPLKPFRASLLLSE